MHKIWGLSYMNHKEVEESEIEKGRESAGK